MSFRKKFPISRMTGAEKNHRIFWKPVFDKLPEEYKSSCCTYDPIWLAIPIQTSFMVYTEKLFHNHDKLNKLQCETFKFVMIYLSAGCFLHG